MREPFHILFVISSGNSAIARVTVGEGGAFAVLISWENSPDETERAEGDEVVMHVLETLGLNVNLVGSKMLPTKAAAEMEQTAFLAKSAMAVNKN